MRGVRERPQVRCDGPSPRGPVVRRCQYIPVSLHRLEIETERGTNEEGLMYHFGSG